MNGNLTPIAKSSDHEAFCLIPGGVFTTEMCRTRHGTADAGST
jgi:hypothetical protein